MLRFILQFYFEIEKNSMQPDIILSWNVYPKYDFVSVQFAC